MTIDKMVQISEAAKVCTMCSGENCVHKEACYRHELENPLFKYTSSLIAIACISKDYKLFISRKEGVNSEQS